MKPRSRVVLTAVVVMTVLLVLRLRHNNEEQSAPGKLPLDSPASAQVDVTHPADVDAQSFTNVQAKPSVTAEVPAQSNPPTAQQVAFKEFLEKMNRYSEAAHERFNLLQQDSTLNHNGEENRNQAAFQQMRLTFEELGRMSATNDDVLQLLVDASHSEYLKGVAVAGLGVAAQNGNEKAVDMLINPEKNGWLFSSSAGALVKVAQDGNDQAIRFMQEITTDVANRALWNFAADALAPAAETGNEVAIGGLINMLEVEQPSIRSKISEALNIAVKNGSQSAAAALAQVQAKATARLTSP